MTSEFKAGDVVTCTEHSHPMTVVFTATYGVRCMWVEDGLRYMGIFRPEELTLSDEQPMPDLNLGGGE